MTALLSTAGQSWLARACIIFCLFFSLWCQFKIASLPHWGALLVWSCAQGMCAALQTPSLLLLYGRFIYTCKIDGTNCVLELRSGQKTACWSCRFVTCFVTVFATVIAITKDLPDIEGDRKYNIDTLATRLGVRTIAFAGKHPSLPDSPVLSSSC